MHKDGKWYRYTYVNMFLCGGVCVRVRKRMNMFLSVGARVHVRKTVNMLLCRRVRLRVRKGMNMFLCGGVRARVRKTVTMFLRGGVRVRVRKAVNMFLCGGVSDSTLFSFKKKKETFERGLLQNTGNGQTRMSRYELRYRYCTFVKHVTLSRDNVRDNQETGNLIRRVSIGHVT